MAACRARGAGELEGAVLEALLASSTAMTAGEVRQVVGEDLAYTTILTILVRLHDKGALERERHGRAHAYRPVSDRAGLVARRSDRAGLVARRMSQALDSSTERGTVLARFVDDLSDADGALLRRLLGK